MSAIFGFTFCPVGDRKTSLHIYIYRWNMELTGLALVDINEGLKEEYSMEQDRFS